MEQNNLTLSEIMFEIENLQNNPDQSNVAARGKELMELLLNKIDAYGIAYNNKIIGARADIKAQLDHYQKLYDDNLKEEENMKNRLTYLMNVNGYEELHGNLFHITFRKCPASVAIINEDLIPDTFKHLTPPKIVVDKKLVAEELKAGRPVLGAQLITDKKNIVIK